MSFVLNVDGSCLDDSGRGDFGGLIWYGDGAWIIGFNDYLNIANNMFVELMALYHGLKIVRGQVKIVFSAILIQKLCWTVLARIIIHSVDMLLQ
jgi:ribonuclease HI